MSRAINVEVIIKNGENQERAIKRFFKKCKKQDVVREHIDKTSYYLTKSQKRRNKRIKNKFLREKQRK